VKKLSIVVVLLLAACTTDLTLPPAIDGIVGPRPENFSVTTTDDILYDLSWSVTDPTIVQFYRVYAFDVTGFPSLLDTTSSTAVQVNTTIPTPGVFFGVTSVSTDNIEGPLAAARAE
jgi:hypothetical protein